MIPQRGEPWDLRGVRSDEAPRLPPRGQQSKSQQNPDDGDPLADVERAERSFEPEMGERDHGRYVGEPMKLAPSPAKYGHRRSVRRRRQRHEQHKRDRTDRDERVRNDALEHRTQLEGPVKDGPQDQMRRTIEEGCQPECAAQLNDVVPPGDAAYGRHEQRHNEKTKTPVSCVVDHVAWIEGGRSDGDDAEAKYRGRQEGGDQ